MLILAVREVATFGRLSRIDGLRRQADTVRTTNDLRQARALMKQVLRLYDGRKETRWDRRRLVESLDDVLDAALLTEALESELLGPLDQLASSEVETAARQVAIATAILPMAFADVAAALIANLRMIRRVAEIYGGRSGFLGSWRLTRAVLTHLAFTGSLEVAEDLLGEALGGSLLGKLSRRFGEGLMNGVLTVRVGVAAMEVCRPMPFSARRRPSVQGMARKRNDRPVCWQGELNSIHDLHPGPRLSGFLPNAGSAPVAAPGRDSALAEVPGDNPPKSLWTSGTRKPRSAPSAAAPAR